MKKKDLLRSPQQCIKNKLIFLFFPWIHQSFLPLIHIFVFEKNFRFFFFFIFPLSFHHPRSLLSALFHRLARPIASVGDKKSVAVTGDAKLYALLTCKHTHPKFDGLYAKLSLLILFFSPFFFVFFKFLNSCIFVLNVCQDIIGRRMILDSGWNENSYLPVRRRVSVLAVWVKILAAASPLYRFYERRSSEPYLPANGSSFFFRIFILLFPF